MKYSLILFAGLLVICNSRGQTSGSAYSIVGIGDINPEATISSRSMQGLSMFRDSIQMSIQNPASYANLKLVNFILGGTYKYLKLSNESNTELLESFDLGYAGFGFKATKKLGIGFGLTPYSNRVYKIRVLYENTKEQDFRQGIGGVTRFYLSAGYKIAKNFNIGATLHYNFGQIEDRSLLQKEGVQLRTQTVKYFKIGGVSYTISATYESQFLEKFKIYASAIFSPQVVISSKNTGYQSVIDQLNNPHTSENIDFSSRNMEVSTITLPRDMTLGVGFSKPNKWYAGFEYHYSEQSKFMASPIGLNKSGSVQNVIYYAVGGRYIPKFNAYDNGFFKRTIYIAGLSYGDDRVPLPNEKITKFGVSVGLGIPMGAYNKFDIGFEYKIRSAESQQLAKERTYGIMVGFSFNDLWFQKRKYN